MNKRILVLSSVLSLALAGVSHGRDLTVVAYGGSTQAGMKEAWFAPFAAKTGKPIAEDEGPSLAKLRAMVETNSVQWDVVEQESSEAKAGCEEGIFERLDFDKIGADLRDFVPGTTSECGFGEYTAANVLAYDSARFPEGPKSWKDFWDMKKFPGKRGFWNTPKGTLEAALMADGVEPADIYKILSAKGGVDRAFKKLDELKPNIVWWNTGAEFINRLASGDYAMTYAWNGRITDANVKDGRKFKIVWEAGYSYVNNQFVVPKGSDNLDKAYDFFKFISSPERQTEFMKRVAYSAPSMKGSALLDQERQDVMPLSEKNRKFGFSIDDDFWASNFDSLSQRFNTWAGN